MTSSLRKPGTLILLTVSVVVGCAVVAAIATVVYALTSWEPFPSGDGNTDSRAAKGSDPGISFEQASRDLSLTLPGNASRLRYVARHDSRPYFLQFSFVMPCSSMVGFRDQNDLVRESEGRPGAPPPASLREVADALGGPLPDGAATVWTDGNDHDLTNRTAAGVPLNDHDCRVVGAFADYT